MPPEFTRKIVEAICFLLLKEGDSEEKYMRMGWTRLQVRWPAWMPFHSLTFRHLTHPNTHTHTHTHTHNTHRVGWTGRVACR